MWGLTRLKLVHGQMSACQTRPATQSLASNVCGGGASLSLITGLARLILEGPDRCELMLQQCLTDRRQIDRKYSD